jgi:hypothetical protein
MHRLRIDLITMIADLASAVAVPWISLRIENQQATEYVERLRNGLPVASGLQGGVVYVALVPFGAGPFFWFLVGLAAAVFYWLLRWRNR